MKKIFLYSQCRRREFFVLLFCAPKVWQKKLYLARRRRDFFFRYSARCRRDFFFILRVKGVKKVFDILRANGVQNIFDILRVAGTKRLFVILRGKGVKKVFDILRAAGAILFSVTLRANSLSQQGCPRHSPLLEFCSLLPLSNEAARVKVNFGVCCKSTGVASGKFSSARETTSECQWWRRGKGSVGPLSSASLKDRAQSNGAETREIRWHRRDFGAGPSGWRKGTMSVRRRKNSF